MGPKLYLSANLCKWLRYNIMGCVNPKERGSEVNNKTFNPPVDRKIPHHKPIQPEFPKNIQNP